MILENKKDHLMTVKSNNNGTEGTSSDTELPNNPSDPDKLEDKLGYGDNKLTTLLAVRALELAGKRATSWLVAEEKAGPSWATLSDRKKEKLIKKASDDLNYYWGSIYKDKNRDKDTPPKYGYLDRKEGRRKVWDPYSKKYRLYRAFDYWLNPKGKRWLERNFPLAQMGFSPRADRFKIPGLEPETELGNHPHEGE